MFCFAGQSKWLHEELRAIQARDDEDGVSRRPPRVEVGLISAEDMAIQWAHDLLDIEQVIKLTEDCDKDCSSCSRIDRMDCHLEMREAVHSLAIHFKTYVLAQVEMSGSVSSQPEKPNPFVS